VIGRYGIKWTPKELAGVIGHELIGHGLQFLHRRHDSMRELERECEARLYQERVNQDVGVNKMSRMSIAVRKTMEDKYCAGFKRFMKQKSPSLMGLWDEINPDVPRLLELFEPYLAELTRNGTTRNAVNADRQSRIRHLRSAAMDGDAIAQYQLGMLYLRGKILQKNPASAAKWFEKAAQQGHARAQHNLAIIYDEGHGVARDSAKAYFWYGLSRKHGAKRIVSHAIDARKRLIVGMDETQSKRIDARISVWRPVGETP
jgi:hypothetical protein